ncbi:MAG TPA: pyridoxal-phosphate dependent enzyme [Gemmatimonadaceae bacterium]|nr:pyridoxal-phosphate dependent enzyme [Gemmatimonadaceae bacterium]
MTLPLFRRFPRLASIPHVSLGAFPSPVVCTTVAQGSPLWIKRDDRNATRAAGNKLRALEFLLAETRPGDTVVTAGGEGSTHVLVTATLAAERGAKTVAIRWPHDMNEVADRVSARICGSCRLVAAGGPLRATLRGLVMQRSGALWIPIGGTSLLGMLGHVNAGLELAEQVARGELPEPARLVVAVGSGGTAAGLTLGLAIAGLRTVVVGARTAPLTIANRWRLLRLVRRARLFLAARAAEEVPVVATERLQIVHDVFGGAYGRRLPAARCAPADSVERGDMVVDPTYTEKALVAAVSIAQRFEGPTLYWHTFDGRLLGERAA